VHTVVWAFFVVTIVAVPISAWGRRYDRAWGFAGIVFVEILVLLFNGWQCPLTAIAARYTADRRANFDIYLPEWLARYNKEIFGTLFGFGLLFTLARWLGWLG
jgi:polyferredoxin